LAIRKQHGNLIIGIDPGATGAIALYDQRDGSLRAQPMPKSTADMYLMAVDLIDARGTNRDAWIYIEKVFGGPRMASYAAFTFGVNYGKCMLMSQMVTSPSKIVQVQPARWQRDLELQTAGLPGVTEDIGANATIKKNINKIRAASLYPDVAVSLKTADAILLAHYGRLKQQEAAANQERVKRKKARRKGARGGKV